jgi:PAS domain S-box-containing protein
VSTRKQAEAQLLQQQIEQQILLDLIPAMVWYKDPHNRILRVNRKAAESIQKTAAEIEGRFTEDFYPEEAAKYHRDDVEVITSGQPKLGIVERYRTGSGKLRWVHTDKVPYCDKEGKNLGVLVFAQDITDQKEMDEALRESEERLRVMVESTPNGMVMVEADGRIVLVNRHFARQFGYAPHELLGQSIDCLVPERFRTDDPAHRADCLLPPTGLTSSRRDIVGLRKDGSEFPLKVTLASLATKNGAYVVASASSIDAEETPLL